MIFTQKHPVDLAATYRRRFGSEVGFRDKMWKVLCRDFFQKYIPEEAVVMEVAAGYCEFINNIVAGKKMALDLNTDVKKFAQSDIKVFMNSSTNMCDVPDDSCDVVFVSNFFEHLTKEDILKTLKEVRRILIQKGKLLILQPNIRYCYKDYWNFFDHITPLDDRSLTEALETNGFQVVESRPKFLPYSTKSKFPKSIFLIKWYLRLPFVHRFFGKQSFICALKL